MYLISIIILAQYQTPRMRRNTIILTLRANDFSPLRKKKKWWLNFVVVQSLSLVQLFVIPWTAACQASLSFIVSCNLLKLMSIESVMPYNHLILSHTLLLLPSVFSSIRVFSNESALCIRWPKYWHFSFSISPFNVYSGLIPLGLTGLISLLSKGLSRVFSITSVWKHQFFIAQTSLWPNSHISTWLLEKPKFWLYGPLLAKWCLCFLMHCLCFSWPFFQGKLQ